MESNGGSKRRGLISKSKLVLSFYRAAAKPASSAAALQQPRTASKTAAKGSSSANHQYLQPTKPPAKGPTPSSSKMVAAASSSSPLGILIVNHVHQDHHQVFAQQAPKVAFVVKERNRDSYNGKLENFYGGAAEDEAVDAKAARYISNVQERFRLERVNSDPNINNYDAPVAAAPIYI